MAGVAYDLRTALYGPQGFPVWGTKFDELEQQGMQVGLEVARLFLEQSLASQAQAGMPPEALAAQEGETPQVIRKDFPATLETPAGEVQWQQPQARLAHARRDFFPSGQSAGD